MNRSLVRAFVFITLVIACFALVPQARAVCQEGCFTNQNTALGEDALLHNTEDNNTAVGFNALFSNTTGTFDTGIGASALSNNTSGVDNTGVGFNVLEFNTTGGGNTAIGSQALGLNTFGNSNTASGSEALGANTTGDTNTATGFNTLLNSTTGSGNTATGFSALSNSTTGNNNIALGSLAGTNITTGSSNIDIGNNGVAGDHKTIRIGKRGLQTATYIAAISGATVPTGVAVIIDSSGHLGTTTSSARFKEAINQMDKASEAILALKPVTFHYKHELDPEGIPQFGLVAEDVEKVSPDLVARDKEGKPYTVRYDAVNAMLLNEFLKARRQIDAQQKQIEALTAGLQRVSAQIELSKSAPAAGLASQ